MTNEELIKTLEKYVRNGNCFTTEVRNILVTYKNVGGLKDNAQKLIEQLAMSFYKTKHTTYLTLLQVGVILK